MYFGRDLNAALLYLDISPSAPLRLSARHPDGGSRGSSGEGGGIAALSASSPSLPATAVPPVAAVVGSSSPYKHASYTSVYLPGFLSLALAILSAFSCSGGFRVS